MSELVQSVKQFALLPGRFNIFQPLLGNPSTHSLRVSRSFLRPSVIRLFDHSFIHSPIHSLVWSFVSSFVQSESARHAFIHSFIYSFMHACSIHWLTYLRTHSFIHSVCQLVSQSVRKLKSFPICSFFMTMARLIPKPIARLSFLSANGEKRKKDRVLL